MLSIESSTEKLIQFDEHLKNILILLNFNEIDHDQLVVRLCNFGAFLLPEFPKSSAAEIAAEVIEVSSIYKSFQAKSFDFSSIKFDSEFGEQKHFDVGIAVVQAIHGKLSSEQEPDIIDPQELFLETSMKRIA